MARTSGSAAACSTKRLTVPANESYGMVHEDVAPIEGREDVGIAPRRHVDRIGRRSGLERGVLQLWSVER
jgi:hypothetical protein